MLSGELYSKIQASLAISQCLLWSFLWYTQSSGQGTYLAPLLSFFCWPFLNSFSGIDTLSLSPETHHILHLVWFTWTVSTHSFLPILPFPREMTCSRSFPSRTLLQGKSNILLMCFLALRESDFCTSSGVYVLWTTVWEVYCLRDKAVVLPPFYLQRPTTW